MTQQASTYVFAGGLDFSTSPLTMPPGKLMSGMNYEIVSEGYRRCDGFERFDGKPAPSLAPFWLLYFDNGVSAILAGATVTGQTSGATGLVLTGPQDLIGDWNSASASGELVLANVTGTFIDNEYLYVGGVAKARADGTAVEDEADDERTRKQFSALAQDQRRTTIGTVPGGGPVRGVAIYQGVIYAWRDNAADTEGKMWKATPAGWVAVNLGRIIRFTAGLIEIIEGTVVNGATSGASATAARVVRTSGDWGTTAAGYIILTGIVGAFGAEVLRVVATNVATVTADTPITLPKGGRYSAITHNFFGTPSRNSMYACNGVGNAFEFNASLFVPIETGTPVDRPIRVFEIGQSLGLIYPGGSVQTSVSGEPLIWDTVQGAAEFAFGTEITDVVQSNETAVVIFGEQKIGILSGTDVDTFRLEELTEEAGADAWTAQRIARTIYIDGRGLRDLSATQAYGNFRAGTLINEIDPYFRSKRKAGARPVASFVSRAKSQYRVIWDDGTGLSVFMGRKYAEALEFSIDPVSATCACTGELADGEGIFIGAVDGYVYRIDSGTSFDGAGVKGFIMPAFNHIGSLMQDKRLHKTTVEMDAEPETQIGITVMFDYGGDEQPISGAQDFTTRGAGGHDLLVQGGGGIWDTAIWNEFFWSAPLRGKAEAYTEGQGVNMAPIIACDSLPAEAPHTLQAYSFHWSARKLRR